MPAMYKPQLSRLTVSTVGEKSHGKSHIRIERMVSGGACFKSGDYHGLPVMPWSVVDFRVEQVKFANVYINKCPYLEVRIFLPTNYFSLG